MFIGSRGRVAAFLASVVITYVSSYFLLSASGHFRDNVSVLDEFNPPCLCVSSWEQWQPALIKAAYLPESDDAPYLLANGLGRFYFPLVRLDQKYWHRNRHIILGR
jgi:hypothetical protein